MNKYTISNVNVLPLSSNEVLTGQDVIIKDQKIDQILPHSNNEKTGPTDIDGTNKFLMPGLVDSHAHVGELQYNNLFLMNGITAIRDTGSINPKIFSYRDAVFDGKLDAPLIYTSGKIIEGKPSFWDGFESAGSKKEVEEAIDRQIEAGADFIKVYDSLSPELYKYAIKIAKNRGKKVAGHKHYEVDIATIVDTGLNSIEHYYGVVRIDAVESEPANLEGYDDSWRRFLKCEIDKQSLDTFISSVEGKGIYLCPTLTLAINKNKALMNFDKTVEEDKNLRYMDKKYVLEDWNPSSESASPDIKDMRPLYAENSLKMSQAFLPVVPELSKHVNILAGTDTENPFVVPGFSLHDELELLVESGLSEYDALRSAAVTPAQFLDESDRWGTVEEGKLANLVLLEGNPLEAISNTRKLDKTIILGKVYDVSEIKKKTEFKW